MRKIIPGIIGLGYVGLPIFTRLQNKFKTIGYDINEKRISTLNRGFDFNLEFSRKYLKKKNNSVYTNRIRYLRESNFYIVTVPTPILLNKKPNLKPLISASKLLGKVVKKDDVIFFESTVYPGVTSNMILIIENNSNLKSGKDFWVGYSPERVNPGDKTKTINKITKIVSFENFPKQIKKRVLKVYKAITPKLAISNSLKEAETSKVIENIQRDINIAFMNEILMICERLKIDFHNVLKLANTKWNFLDFKPGLVGGHCLPVDPYYLHDLAKLNNINAQLILAGRNTNNQMEKFVIKKIYTKISQNKKDKKISKILIAGITFKRNVSDIRNSIPLSIYNKIKKDKNLDVYVADPRISINRKIRLINFKKFKANDYNLIVYLVNHDEIQKSLKKVKSKNKVLDIFNFLN